MESLHTAIIESTLQMRRFSNVSNLFASEFEKQLPSIITRAIVGAMLKFGITETINAVGWGLWCDYWTCKHFSF